MQSKLPPLKSGEEKFEIAVQGNVIAVSPLERLKEVLRLVMLKVGIRGNNLPEEEEKAVLLMHIVEYYGRHTCEEIKLAFDLALEDKLDLEMKEVKTYENFSCLYFSTIMNAYRKWSVQPRYKYENKKKQLTLPYEEREKLSDEDMEAWIKEWDAEKLKKVTVGYIPILFYDWLAYKGFINLVNDEKDEYLRKAALHRKLECETIQTDNKYMQKSFKQFLYEFQNNNFSEGTIHQLMQLARKIAVFDYLKKKANDVSILSTT